MMRLLSQPERPTAVFARTDELAVGACVSERLVMACHVLPCGLRESVQSMVVVFIYVRAQNRFAQTSRTAVDQQLQLFRIKPRCFGCQLVCAHVARVELLDFSKVVSAANGPQAPGVRVLA